MAGRRITQETFKTEVLRGDEPVVVRFFGQGDHASALMESILDSFEARDPGRLKIVSLEASEGASSVARYAVLSLPTLVLFAAGREEGRLTGLRSAKRVTRFLHKSCPSGVVR